MVVDRLRHAGDHRLPAPLPSAAAQPDPGADQATRTDGDDDPDDDRGRREVAVVGRRRLRVRHPGLPVLQQQPPGLAQIVRRAQQGGHPHAPRGLCWPRRKKASHLAAPAGRCHTRRSSRPRSWRTLRTWSASPSPGPAACPQDRAPPADRPLHTHALCSIPDPQEAKGKLGRTDVEEAGLLDARQQALVRPERVGVLAQRVFRRFPARLRSGPTASGMHVAVWVAREANQPATTAQVVKQSSAWRKTDRSGAYSLRSPTRMDPLQGPLSSLPPISVAAGRSFF